MTQDKIIAAAREAGAYADIEYQRRWESGEGGAWSQIRDERFYAIAYRQGLEDAANECERIAREEYSMNGLYEYGECATAIRSLKESTNG